MCLSGFSARQISLSVCVWTIVLGSCRSTDERLAAVAFREFRQFVFETLRLEGEPSLPPTYLPSAVACLSLFAALTLHALFHLMCRWSAAFEAKALYAPAARLDERCYVVVQPPPNRGDAVIVPVRRSDNGGELQMDFQRQRYFYQSPSVLLR